MESVIKWVLIFAAYVIYMAIKGATAKSKKPVEVDQDEEVESLPTPVPMRPIMGGSPRKRVPVRNGTVPTIPDAVIEKSAGKRARKVAKKNTENKIENEALPVSEHITNTASHDVEQGFNEDFDLRQAFIYSEILKTKFEE